MKKSRSRQQTDAAQIAMSCVEYTTTFLSPDQARDVIELMDEVDNGGPINMREIEQRMGEELAREFIDNLCKYARQIRAIASVSSQG